MRTDPRLILAAAACASAFAASPALAQQHPSECDRACLEQTAQDFLAAVAAHDASLLDWNAYARWTLNGVELPFSEAIWGLENEVSGVRQIVVPDAETGEVGIVTTWTFDGTPALMAARLKVEWGRLSEAETIVVTQPGPSGPPGAQVPPPPGPQFAELGALSPVFAETVAQPAARDALIVAADRWFDALASGGNATAAPDCVQTQNGAGADCSGPGAFAPVTEIAPRRYPAVDSSRGLVFAVARLNDDGAASQQAPGSTLAGYLLKIEDGQVAAAEAVGEAMFYYLPTGWDAE